MTSSQSASKTMSESETMALRGIGEILALIGEGLRTANLPGQALQRVVEIQGDALAAEVVAMVRHRVEAVTGMILRSVRVDRSRTPEQALNATGRAKYGDDEVARSMPRGSSEKTDVFFFQAGGMIGDEELERRYQFFNLVPVDPFTLAALNEADPTFSREYPNGTHWKDASDHWCSAAFDHQSSGGRVVVGRSVPWHDYWWFGGVRK